MESGGRLVSSGPPQEERIDQPGLGSEQSGSSNCFASRSAEAKISRTIALISPPLLDHFHEVGIEFFTPCGGAGGGRDWIAAGSHPEAARGPV